MKNCLIAAAILLGPAAGLVSAEYLMIKLDLNKVLALPPGPNRQNQPNAPRGAPPPTSPDSEEPPLWATAYLQLKLPAQLILNSRFYRIDDPWGTALIPQSLDKFGTLHFYHQASAVQRFAERQKALDREGKTPEKLLHLAQWALEHGQTASFLKTMDEVAKLDAKNAKVLAVNQVKAALARPLTGLDPGSQALVDEFKRENFRLLTSEGSHYALFTDLNAAGQDDSAMKKWVERLEDNYRTFFYWFAVHGKALPVPKHRLVAVVVAGGKDFENKYESYHPGPRVAAGFLVRRPNVVVFSALPLEEAYKQLDGYNRKEWELARVTREDLLTGAVAKRTDLAMDPSFVAKMQLLALMQKSMEKESARAAVTCEGTRQLLAASNLLPRGVVTAEWAHSGLASYFETPFQAFYISAGLPHWIYLVEFKHLKKAGELGKASDVLLKTISDDYFHVASATQQRIDSNKEERELVEPMLQDELLKARTTAWALTYYLAKHRLANLERYYEELARLPRDLEFDESVLLGCFARAFDLGDAADPGKLDPAKLNRLADAWYAAMEGENLDLLEVQNEALKERANTKRPGPEGTQP